MSSRMIICFIFILVCVSAVFAPALNIRSEAIDSEALHLELDIIEATVEELRVFLIKTTGVGHE